MKQWMFTAVNFLMCLGLWAQQFQHAGQIGGTGFQSAFGITTDPAGNIYATGVHAGTTDFDPGAGIQNITSNGSQDAYLCKWTASGQHIWSFTLGGAEPDGGQAIAYDNGFIYVGGRFRDSVDFDFGPGVELLVASARDDMYVVKYDTSGQFIWVRTWGGPHDEELADIAIDPNGNITLCGLFSGPMDFDPGTGTDIRASTGTQDAFVCQLDPAGQYKFAGTFGSAPGEFANGVDHDPMGNLYVTGQFWGTVDFDPGPGVANRNASSFNADLFLFSWDNGGNFRWVESVGSSGGNEIGYAIVEQGGVVTAGGGFQGTADFDPGVGIHTLTSAGDYDHFIWQLDTAGQFVNAVRTGGPNNDVVWGLEVSGDGSIFGTGYFSTTSDFDPGPGVHNLTSNGGGDVFVLELDMGLNLASVYQIGGTSSDYGQTIHLNRQGEAITGGQFSRTADFDPGLGVSNLSSVLNTTDGFITSALYCTPSKDTISVSICPGDSVLVGGTYYHQPGTYQAFFTGADGCDSIVTAEITFFITISTSSDTSICPGASATLEVFASQGSIQWSTGDTSSSIVTDSAGVYVVAVKAMGCSVYDSITVTVWPHPTLNLGPDISVCLGDSVVINAPNTFSTYQWNTGIMQPQMKVDTGTYWLQVLDSNGCSASDTVAVQHYPIPSYSWPDDTSVCQYETLVLQGPAGFTNYLWPDGTMDSLYVATTTALSDSQYTIQVQLTDAFGCVTLDSIRVQIYRPRDLLLPGTIWACPGDTVKLVAASGFTQYSWSTGSTGQMLLLETDGFTSDTIPIVLSALDSNGCQSLDTTQLVLHTPARLGLGSDTVVCNGAPVEFSFPRNFSRYQWSTGDTTASTVILSDTISNSPYTLFASALDSNGCRVEDSVQIEAVSTIPFNLGRDTAVCKGESVEFSGPRGYSDYQWSNGVRSQNLRVLTDTVSVPSIAFTLIASDSNGCPSTDTVQLTILTPAPFQLIDDTTICEGEYLEVLAPVGFSRYQWSNEDTGQVLQLMSDTLAIGTHWFVVTAMDDNGCLVQDSLALMVEECPGISSSMLAGISVYPNPVGQKLFIEIQPGMEGQLWLQDLQGRKILSKQVQEQQIHIDMTQLPEGVYLLKIQMARCFHTYKVIKVRAQ